jgi:hypothetical protein
MANWRIGFSALALLWLAAVVPPQAIAQCQGLTAVGTVSPLRGHPFQAEVRVAIPGIPPDVITPRERTLNRVSRDSWGRVRVESYDSPFRIATEQKQPTEPYLVFICDPVSPQTLILEPLKKAAYMQKLPVPSTPDSTPATAPRFCDVMLHGEARTRAMQYEPHWDLAHRIIEGVDARGLMDRKPVAFNLGTETGLEDWCSDELGAMVLFNVQSSDGYFVYRAAMTNIQLKEPDATLFSVPPGYIVLDHYVPGPKRSWPVPETRENYR